MTIPADYPMQPAEIWKHFYQLTQIPRPSGLEEKAAEYVLNLAREFGYEHRKDAVGNISVFVPASKGKENLEPLIIQNHLDMVTDAIPGHKINFATDPLELEVVDGWLKAKGTTLGADNGIGCAAALALLTTQGLEHPPLELLFTIDEETGLKGALGIERHLVTGKRMLNLDTEEWGSVYIGCAGGMEIELTSRLEQASASELQFIKLSLGSLIGGHSGIDIHRQRGNANQILASIISKLLENDIELAEFRGGRAHNIIPRDAYAILGVADLSSVEQCIKTFIDEWNLILAHSGDRVSYEIEKVTTPSEVIEKEQAKRLIAAINSFPCGVFKYMQDDRELPSSSNNLAIVLMMNGEFYLQTSLRFMIREELDELKEKVHGVASLAGTSVREVGFYPCWTPNPNSKMLQSFKNAWKMRMGDMPAVKAIHAGLECGILNENLGGVDAISFGPTIEGAHSPDERIEIASVSEFWEQLVSFMGTL